MTQLDTTHIKPRLPQREWLLRCADNDHNLSMYSICVNDGTIEIITADNTIIGLEGSRIAEFHAAFQSAVDVADADLAERAALHTPGPPRPLHDAVGAPCGAAQGSVTDTGTTG